MPGLEQFLDRVREQAVCEVASSLWPYLEGEGRRFMDARILERLVEPDRIVSFRVEWTDDAGAVQINRG